LGIAQLEQVYSFAQEISAGEIIAPVRDVSGFMTGKNCIVFPAVKKRLFW
jgi:hypothetical protein